MIEPGEHVGGVVAAHVAHDERRELLAATGRAAKIRLEDGVAAGDQREVGVPRRPILDGTDRPAVHVQDRRGRAARRAGA